MGIPNDVKKLIIEGNDKITQLWKKMNELVSSNNEMEERISQLEEKVGIQTKESKKETEGEE